MTTKQPAPQCLSQPVAPHELELLRASAAALGAITPADAGIVRTSGVALVLSHAAAHRSDYLTTWDLTDGGQGWICRHRHQSAPQLQTVLAEKAIAASSEPRALPALPARDLISLALPEASTPQPIIATRRAGQMIAAWAKRCPSANTTPTGKHGLIASLGFQARRWFEAVRRAIKAPSLYRAMPIMLGWLVSGC